LDKGIGCLSLNASTREENLRYLVAEKAKTGA